jgi:predicted permease
MPDGEHILGDLREEYAAYVEREDSRLAADLWYWRQLGTSIPSLLARALRGPRIRGRAYEFSGAVGFIGSIVAAPLDRIQDAKLILRDFVRRPIFPLLVVLTLGVGVGVTATTFAVTNSVLLRPLPLPEGENLVFLRHLRLTDPSGQGGRMAPGAFVHYRDGSRLLEAMVAFSTEEVHVTDGTPMAIRIGYPTPGLGEVVGLPPVVGRWNSTEDLTTERWVAVLSHAFWVTRYGGDRSVIGSVLHLDEEAVEIIGVAPPEAASLEPEVQVWVPRPRPLDEQGFGGFGLNAIGRLRSGATLQELDVELSTLWATLGEALPRYERSWRYWNETFQVRPAPRYLLTERVRAVRDWIWLLLVSAAVVFLVGLSNVGTLSLVRSLDRGTDMAVRAAMGGGRPALTRLLATEALLLGGASAGLALLLTWTLLRGLPVVAVELIPRVQDVSLDATTMALTLGLAGIAVFVLVLIPSVRLPRDLAAVLRGSAQGGSPVLRRFQTGLLVLQLGLAAVLVVFGGLMGRSFWSLRSVDLGFSTEGLYTFQLRFPTRDDDDAEDKYAFFRGLQERIRAIPGVSAVSASECVPLRCGLGQGVVVEIDGRWLEEEEVEPIITSSMIIPGYFETLGVSTTRGRDVGWDDAWLPGVGEEWVMHTVLNEKAATELFPDVDPVGRHYRVGANGGRTTVAGVVPDVLLDGLSIGPQRSGLIRYLPDPRFDGMQWVVRSDLPAQVLLPAIREVVWETDPAVPVEGLADYHTLIAEASRDRTLILVLALGGAGLAVALGLVGVYGALSHEVRRRGRELGIRNALGADARALRASVMNRVAMMVLAGLAIGIMLAAASGRLLESVVYGVGTHDPGTYLVAAVVVALVAFGAGFIPAVHASRADPMRALRAE